MFTSFTTRSGEDIHRFDRGKRGLRSGENLGIAIYSNLGRHDRDTGLYNLVEFAREAESNFGRKRSGFTAATEFTCSWRTTQL